MIWSTFNRRIPPTAALAVLVGTGVVAGVSYALLAPREESAGLAGASAGRIVLPRGNYPVRPLAAGTPAPRLRAAGWLNGRPDPVGPAPRLILLDIWSGW